MTCKLCENQNINIEYEGKIKSLFVNGNADFTKEDVKVHKCLDCDVIWHDYDTPLEYYASEAYRKSISTGATDVESHYKMFDSQVLDKLNGTGTDIFRQKTVADIGCAGGCFLDFVSNVAKHTIGVEPSAIFRDALAAKGYSAFSNLEEALDEFKGKVDVITSFDVIEHVDDPVDFVQSVYDLLHRGGRVIMGTPTDYPLLRKLLGRKFDKFIFSTYHPWVFSEKSLRYLFEKCGYVNISIERKYKYGIGNVMNWLINGTAKGNIEFNLYSETLNKVWQLEMIKAGYAEYLIVSAKKEIE